MFLQPNEVWELINHYEIVKAKIGGIYCHLATLDSTQNQFEPVPKFNKTLVNVVEVTNLVLRIVSRFAGNPLKLAQQIVLPPFK